jgi:hypothetical protein
MTKQEALKKYYGYDNFRPEYRQLSIIKQEFPDVPIVALTATADKVTRKDICKQLQIPEEHTFISSFDRPNISLDVKPGRRRLQQMQEFLNANPNQAGIIYCLSRRTTESVTESLFSKAPEKNLKPFFDFYLRTTAVIDVNVKEIGFQKYQIKINNFFMPLPFVIVSNDKLNKTIIKVKGIVINSIYPPQIAPKGFYLKKITMQ